MGERDDDGSKDDPFGSEASSDIEVVRIGDTKAGDVPTEAPEPEAPADEPPSPPPLPPEAAAPASTGLRLIPEPEPEEPEPESESDPEPEPEVEPEPEPEVDSPESELEAPAGLRFREPEEPAELEESEEPAADLDEAPQSDPFYRAEPADEPAQEFAQESAGELAEEPETPAASEEEPELELPEGVPPPTTVERYVDPDADDDEAAFGGEVPSVEDAEVHPATEPEASEGDEGDEDSEITNEPPAAGRMQLRLRRLRIRPSLLVGGLIAILGAGALLLIPTAPEVEAPPPRPLQPKVDVPPQAAPHSEATNENAADDESAETAEGDPEEPGDASETHLSMKLPGLGRATVAPRRSTIALSQNEELLFEAAVSWKRPFGLRWRLDGELVGVTSRYQLSSADTAVTGRRELELSVEKKGLQTVVRLWTIAVAPPTNFARIVPSAQRLRARLGSSLLLHVELAPSEREGARYRWRLDGLPVDDVTAPRFEYKPEIRGEHTIEVAAWAANGGRAEQIWQIWVGQADDPEEHVHRAILVNWIGEYCGALQRKDTDQLIAMGATSADEENATVLRRALTQMSAYRVHCSTPTVEIDGGRAVARYDRRDSWANAKAVPQRAQRKGVERVFHLEDGRWVPEPATPVSPDVTF